MRANYMKSFIELRVLLRVPTCTEFKPRRNYESCSANVSGASVACDAKLGSMRSLSYVAHSKVSKYKVKLRVI